MEKNKTIHKLKWWIIFMLFWIVVLPLLIFMIVSIKFGFEIFLLVAGIFSTVFNKQLYSYMVKLNTWGSKKMGIPIFGKAVKSRFYMIYYRIIVFIMGLFILYIAISRILSYFGINSRLLLFGV